MLGLVPAFTMVVLITMAYNKSSSSSSDCVFLFLSLERFLSQSKLTSLCDDEINAMVRAQSSENLMY
jgi:hypothetical protein